MKDCYIKIIKIIPINFNLKSEMEKEAILNSYKIFFKTCNFDIQIVIQSKKEDLSKHILSLKTQEKNESKEIQEIASQYIDYISELNKKRKSSTKNFFIILKSKEISKEVENEELIICDELNENFLKVKDCLSRCGNVVVDYSEKEEIKNILFSFLNSQKFIFE